VLDDAVDKSGESASVTEPASLNLVEDVGKGFVELVFAVDVGVAKVINVFGQVAEKEDVVLSDFASDLNLNNR
jgi:hypothetical protein